MPKIIEPVLTPQDAEWGRQVNDRQLEAERTLERLALEGEAANKGLGASLASLSEQILALPIVLASSATEQPISTNSASWITKATTSVIVPSGKTRAVVSLVGSIALLDTVSGGVAAPPSARFLIGGTAYPLENGVPATKDPGASQVNNVVTIGAAAEFVGLEPGSTLSAFIQVRTSHLTAYATSSFSNFATLAMTVTFNK